MKKFDVYYRSSFGTLNFHAGFPARDVDDVMNCFDRVEELTEIPQVNYGTNVLADSLQDDYTNTRDGPGEIGEIKNVSALAESGR
jgi:hypothetical protein